VRLAGRDFKSFAGLEDEVVMLDFEGEFSFEDEEELARAEVGVASFAGAGRHELFDDAEFGSFHEMPTVTVGSVDAAPLIVFRGSRADDL
jgi:hypothetical protein